MNINCCYGISSECDNFQHVLMMDYDGISLNTVKEHLKYIQKDYDLSDIYIIKSKHGYNAISLDKMQLSIIYHLGISVFSPTDRNFFKYGFERQYYVLRFDNDKELVEILKNNSSKYEKSLAHKLFLEFFFNMKINCNNLGHNTKLKIIQYPSYKNGFHSVPKNVDGYIDDLKRWKQ